MTGRFSKGIRFAGLGALYFSVMSACAKLAGSRLPSQEIVFFRAIVVTGLTYAVLRSRGLSPWGAEPGRKPLGIERRLLLLRGLFGYAALSCFLWAVIRLPLADATVIHFTNPVWTALLAAFFIGEVLRGWEVLLAVVALGGVVLVARPGFLVGQVSGLDPLAVAAALAGAVLSAAAYVTAKRLTRTQDPLVIVFAFAAMSLVGSIPPTLRNFVMPDLLGWVLLLGVGLGAQGGQVYVTKALQVEKAARVMAVGYLQIVFAAAWGLILFQEVPDRWTGLGAAVIIGSTFVMG
ncbi:MAG: DMT family transporter, partial [Gemmatimonadetes bacterium]|nr:DMT family transporter [Gemmatimonadota bacterium]